MKVNLVNQETAKEKWSVLLFLYTDEQTEISEAIFRSYNITYKTKKKRRRRIKERERGRENYFRNLSGTHPCENCFNKSDKTLSNTSTAVHSII